MYNVLQTKKKRAQINIYTVPQTPPNAPKNKPMDNHTNTNITLLNYEPTHTLLHYLRLILLLLIYYYFYIYTIPIQMYYY